MSNSQHAIMDGLAPKFLSMLLVIAVAAICMVQPTNSSAVLAASHATGRPMGCSQNMPPTGGKAPQPSHFTCCQSGHPAALLPTSPSAVRSISVAKQEPISLKNRRADVSSGMSRMNRPADPPAFPQLRV